MAKGAFRIFIGLGVAGLLSSCTWIYSSLRRTEFGRSPSLPEASGPLQLSHSTWVADPGQPLKLTASGVAGTSSFSLVSGPGSIDPFSGLFTPGKIFGTSVVRITDQLGRTAQANITQIPTWLWANGNIRAIVFDSQGNLFIGGDFTTVGRQFPARSLLSLDTSRGLPRGDCDLQTGFNGATSAVLRTDSAFFVGGDFTLYRGVEVQRLVKLDFNCQLDSVFTQSLGFDAPVTAIAFDSKQNALYVGGAFSSYRGVANSTQRLAKLDATTGVLDTQFTRPNSGFNDSISALAMHPESQSVYVGGAFTSYRGVANNAHRLAKLHLNTGDLDTNFTRNNSGFFGAGTPVVSALNLHSGKNSLFVGGSFSQYRGVANSAQNLAKLDLSTGDLDTLFTRNNSGFNFPVSTLTLHTGLNALYVGGGFTQYRGVANNAQRLAKLDLDSGDLDTNFTRLNDGFNSLVSAMVLNPQKNELFLAGAFSSYRSLPTQHFAKVDPLTGELEPGFSQKGGLLMSLNFVSPHVAGLSLDARGDSLLVVGNFSQHLEFTENAQRLAKFNFETGMLDTQFTRANGGFDDEVLSLALNESSQSLYVGGRFTAYRGVANSALGLAKLHSGSGDLDTVFTQSGNGVGGSIPSVSVKTLAIHPGRNALYVGGWFDRYRGVQTECLAKVDLTSGALDPVFTQTNGFGSTGIVYDLALNEANNSLYVGGEFTSYRLTLPARRLAKLDLDSGNLDTNFTRSSGFEFFGLPPGLPLVSTLAIDTFSNSLYVGGDFQTYRGVANSAHRLAKLDLSSGNLDTVFTQTSNGFCCGSIADPLDMQINRANNSLYVVGLFSKYRGLDSTGMAKIDLNSGSLDTQFSNTNNALPSRLSLFIRPGDSSVFIGGASLYGYRGSALYGQALLRLDLGNGDPK